jgi:hypothetical protein
MHKTSTVTTLNVKPVWLAIIQLREPSREGTAVDTTGDGYSDPDRLCTSNRTSSWLSG